MINIKGEKTLYLHITQKILKNQRDNSNISLINDDIDHPTTMRIIADLIRYRVIGKNYPTAPEFMFSHQVRNFVAKSEVKNSLTDI